MSDAVQGRVAILRSNPVSPDPRVEKLARVLLESGRLVLILAWDRTGALPRVEEDTPIGNLYRLGLRAKYGSGIRNLPYLVLWQIFLLVNLFSRHRRYDVIHACDFDTVMPALLVGRLLGKPVVFDIFDLYSDSVRGTPAPILRLVAWMETFAINHARAVILADESRKNQIAPSRPKKLVVVNNAPEEAAGPALAGETGSGKFRLVYVGLLVKERSLMEVIEIVGKHPEWHLDLAGFGGDEAMITAQARQHPNIAWHGRVDYATALALTAAADVVFAIYDPAVPNHRYSSPNKVFEAMMLGKPLVVAQGTNMDRIVVQHGCGMVVPYGQVEAIEKAFQAITDDAELRSDLGANGRIAYEQHYSWKLMRKRIVQLYCEL